MAIPAKLEELILDGKARFETYQCAFTEANVIPVQSKEFIVVTGMLMQAAFGCRYSSVGLKSTVQRIELFDGNSYNHFFAKQGGKTAQTQDDVENHVHFSDLYCVFHSDLGVMVTVPESEAVDWSGNFQSLDGSNGDAARKVVNQGTNPYNANPMQVLGRTRGFSAGTDNVPFNRKPNANNYSSSFNGGPVAGGSTNQFNFTSADERVTYNNTADYPAVGPSEYRQGWYLSVHYVRVFETGTNIR
jgi:hypothetical protein